MSRDLLPHISLIIYTEFGDNFFFLLYLHFFETPFTIFASMLDLKLYVCTICWNICLIYRNKFFKNKI